MIAPDATSADIYQWKDASGAVHFTDNPENIPKKYQSRKKVVLRNPPGSGRPGLTVIESPMSDPTPANSEPLPQTPPVSSGRGGSQVQAEQLQARIAAKERFVESINLKRSHALNPSGNRFVSPEDLELYNKYSEELPRDRRQLQELQSGRP